MSVLHCGSAILSLHCQECFLLLTAASARERDGPREAEGPGPGPSHLSSNSAPHQPRCCPAQALHLSSALPPLSPGGHQAAAQGWGDLRLVLGPLLLERDQYGLSPALHTMEGVGKCWVGEADGGGGGEGGFPAGPAGARAWSAPREIAKFVWAARLQHTRSSGTVTR